MATKASRLIWQLSSIIYPFPLLSLLVMIGVVWLHGVSRNFILNAFVLASIFVIILLVCKEITFRSIVASFCTPYNPPEQQYIPLENLVEFMPNFKYQLYLVSPEAEQEINQHVRQ